MLSTRHNDQETISLLLLGSRISTLCSEIATLGIRSGADTPPLSPISPADDGLSQAKETSSRPTEALRASLADTAMELLRLVNGPERTLRTLFMSVYDLAALQVAIDKGFFYHTPLSTGLDQPVTTVSDIASKAGMDDDRTARILRLLATQGIFEEVPVKRHAEVYLYPSAAETTTPGSAQFRHTPTSSWLARDPDLYAMGAMQLDDVFAAASTASASITAHPHESDAAHCPFTYRHNVPVYQHYEENPHKGTRFAKAMNFWSRIDRQVEQIRDSFDWRSLGSSSSSSSSSSLSLSSSSLFDLSVGGSGVGAGESSSPPPPPPSPVVVDIGGGDGHISIGLAKEFPSLNFVVQDISPHMLSYSCAAADMLGEGRVQFQKHDYFEQQPIRDASAYFMRQCLHNYSDGDAIRILSALVPALEEAAPGTPLLISDVILPEAGDENVTRFEERQQRQIDLAMMVVLGSKERSRQEFASLLRAADQRLRIVRAHGNPTGGGVLEVHLVRE